MICSVVAETNFNTFMKNLRSAGRKTDFVEARIDYLSKIDDKKLSKIISAGGKHLILTCRKKSEGGKFRGSESKRIALLKKAALFGAPFIDIEFSTSKHLLNDFLRNKKHSKVILSSHNFKSTLSLTSLKKLFSRMKKINGSYALKIVNFANSDADNLNILRFLKSKKSKGKLIAFCMGEKGKTSRFLAHISGSFLSYVPFSKKTALGQLALNELNDIEMVKNICAVVGFPLKHSLSPVMHNAAFKKLKIPYFYLSFELADITPAVAAMRDLGFKGYSITLPHKVSVIKHLDSIDALSRKIVAVNTVVNSKGKLKGYNTDYFGAIAPLKKRLSLKGKKVVLLGAGGAARAIAAGLKGENASCTITDRSLKKAKKLAKRFAFNYTNISGLAQYLNDADVIINATPVGMKPNTGKSLVPGKLLKPRQVVFDIVYSPLETKLLKSARKKGCRIIHGYEMLLMQGIKQFELFTGKKAPTNIMRNALLNSLR